MNQQYDVIQRMRLLLFMLSTSYALYLIVASDIVLTYEIFVALALYITLIGSFGLLFTIVMIVAETKYYPNKIITIAICAIALCYLTTFSYRNGWLEGEKVIGAAFLDDMSRVDLNLYESGKYIIYSNWLFGEERFEGQYALEGDTIKFLTTPVTDNDFIAQEAVIDRNKNRIYFRKLPDGQYEKDFYYFQIDF